MTELIPVETSAQVAAVAALARAVWSEHYVPIIGQAQVDYMLDAFQSGQAIDGQLAEGYEYYLLSDGERNTGYLAVVPDAEAGTLMLSKLYVVKAERGRGYGRMMIDFARRLSRERGLKTLWLTVNKHNTESIAWYRRMGFVSVGPTVQDIGGGFVMDDYRMEMTVDPNVP